MKKCMGILQILPGTFLTEHQSRREYNKRTRSRKQYVTDLTKLVIITSKSMFDFEVCRLVGLFVCLLVRCRSKFWS